MLLANQSFPDGSSRSSLSSPEDRRAYNKIMYGLGGIYAAAVVCLVGADMAGINVQKAAYVVIAAWH